MDILTVDRLSTKNKQKNLPLKCYLTELGRPQYCQYIREIYKR